jgi:3-hydroxyacyl-[acyl-carrier-protein] dehydratase
MLTIQLADNHPLYAGHFPDRPIVPAVCSIEIIKECTASVLKTPLQFIILEQSKFYNPIEPLINKELIVSIKITPLNNLEYSLSGIIMNHQTTFVSIKSIIKKRL